MSSDSQTKARGPSITQVRAEPALLERARLALQSLQFGEEAARYRAACAELIEAIADAEAGNEEPLKRWLDARRSVQDLHPPHTAVPAPHRATEQKIPSDDAIPIEVHQASSLLEPTVLAADSPWETMRVAALQRASSWFQLEQDQAQECVDSSLDFAVELQKAKAVTKKKGSQRWLPPHVILSLAAHGLILLILGWWVVASVQPEKILLLASGPMEREEVSLETTLDPSPIETESTDQTEPPPIAPMDNLSIDIPQIAALEGMTGPRLSESTLASTAGSIRDTGGMGSNLAAGVAFFGSQAAGNNFVFVVDCSPSMAEDNAFESAKTEILRSLSMLKPKQRYFILFFGKEVVPIQFPGKPPERFLLSANSENIEKTVQWLQRMSIQKDGRHPHDAIREALAMQPDGIFLLFDGKTSSENWRERINALNRTDELLSQGEVNIPIHVVHFFQEDYASEMKRLADDNKGTYRFVPRPPKEKRGKR